MKEKKSVFKYMIFGNKLVIICVFFTIATMLDIILCTIFKTDTVTTHFHLIDRMLLSIIAILPLSLLFLISTTPISGSSISTYIYGSTT